MNHTAAYIHPSLRAQAEDLTALGRGPLEPETPALSPAVTFQRLLDRLHPLEPNHGWQSLEQLPALTNADIATVLHREPTVLADACCNEQVLKRVTDALSAEEFSTIQLAAMLGAVLVCAVAQQARKYVLDTLQAESARREQLNRVWDDVERDSFYRQCP